MTLSRRLSWVALALAALAVASACGGDRQSLTIYSGRTEALVRPLLETFSEETSIRIDVRYGDSADLALLLAEEGERTPADVALFQNPGPVDFLDSRGLLGDIDQTTLARANPAFRATDGHWVGVSGRQRVLVYNRDRVGADELPSSVFELTAPRFRGRVAVAPQNGSFQDFVSAMRQLRGDVTTERWLRGMAANDSPTYASNNAIVEAVSRGEVPMGLVNHYYNYRFLAEDPDLPSRNHRFRAGDVGALVIPATASILTSADRPEEAQRFIAFLLEREAQEYFARETFEYPLAADVSPAGGLPPLSELGAPRVSIESFTDLRGTVRMIAESGLG